MMFSSSAGIKEQPMRTSINSDTFLHVQQLRKARLRKFCHQFPELKTLKTPETAKHLLSTLDLNPKLSIVYCKSSDLAVDDWEEMIRFLEGRADVTIRNPVVDNETSALVPGKLENYGQPTLKQILHTFTKVLFVRDPFERLVSTYIEGIAEDTTFDDFIDDTLIEEVGEDGLSYRSVVDVCHPCFVKYDYILMYDFLQVEVHHLVRRLRLPARLRLPRPSGGRSKMTARWLVEHFFYSLSEPLRNRISEAYWCDFAAFPLHNSLLWNSSMGIID
ncbi:carbohydrate sulfotransferase 11-like [Gastrophryne carolinensis]